VADETTIQHVLQSETVPRRPDVIEAKRKILDALQHGRVIPVGVLVAIIGESRGLLEPDKSNRVLLENDADNGQFIAAAQAVIDWYRCQVASHEAIAELQNAGLILSAAEHPPVSYRQVAYIHWTTPTAGGTREGTTVVELDAAYPAAMAYRVPVRLRGELIWGLNVDLVAQNIDSRLWGHRTGRCLEEAIIAYHRCVYLGAASLLGATSEGVWYAAASILKGCDKGLDACYERHQTAQLQERLAKLARPVVEPSYLIDSLLVHAALLREIRNYGVHPRPETADSERYFSEEACGLLFLTTTDYLKELSVALMDLIKSKGRA